MSRSIQEVLCEERDHNIDVGYHTGYRHGSEAALRFVKEWLSNLKEVSEFIDKLLVEFDWTQVKIRGYAKDELKERVEKEKSA